MFDSAGGDEIVLRRIAEFSRSGSAFEKMVQSLPRSVEPMQDIKGIVRCALMRRPADRSLKVLQWQAGLTAEERQQLVKDRQTSKPLQERLGTFTEQVDLGRLEKTSA